MQWEGYLLPGRFRCIRSRGSSPRCHCAVGLNVRGGGDVVAAVVVIVVVAIVVIAIIVVVVEIICVTIFQRAFAGGYRDV